MSQDDALRLEVTNFADPTHWCWRLTDAPGKCLSNSESVAFPDLETGRGRTLGCAGGKPGL
jgi:hypothetical protein